LVVSRFARSDRLLSSEFPVTFPPRLTLSGPDRTPAEYLVTGAVVADGLLYAVSAAYSTLLVIDLRDRTLRGAWAVPGLAEPVGITSRGAHLLVAQADGRVAVIDRPTP
jgi:DNA-binding beta-propeller fold protein YncE